MHGCFNTSTYVYLLPRHPHIDSVLVPPVYSPVIVIKCCSLNSAVTVNNNLLFTDSTTFSCTVFYLIYLGKIKISKQLWRGEKQFNSHLQNYFVFPGNRFFKWNYNCSYRKLDVLIPCQCATQTTNFFRSQRKLTYSWRSEVYIHLSQIHFKLSFSQFLTFNPSKNALSEVS
jgi:hypothetical protein